MSLPLHAIEKACAKGAPGLAALAIIEPSDLVAQPVWHAEPSIPDLTFLPGKSAYLLGIDSFTGRLISKTITGDAAGDRFDYNLAAFRSGLEVGVDFLRAKLLNRRVHIVATYQNAAQRFVPHMRLWADEDSGDRSNKQGYAFSGTTRLLKPAAYVDAVVEVIGGPYVPPDTGTPGSVTLVELSTEDSTFSYTVPSGSWLAGIEVRSTDAQTIKVGTTNGGSEISGFAVPLDALQTWVSNGALFHTFSSNIIYFSDLAGNNSIRVWLLG